MVEVAVFGSCMIDFISYVARMPKTGETLHSHNFETGFGGKGANQAIAAARLGAKTAMVGKVGNDPYGIKYVQHFKSEGVDTELVDVVGEHSGIALIVVSSDGQNQIVINANANKFLKAEDAEKAHNLLTSAKVVVCQLETPLEGTVAALKSCKGFSILNGAPALKLSDDILKIPNIFCVNELEAKEMTGIEIEQIADAKKSIEVLLAKGCQMVIITLGELGAAFNIDHKIYHGALPRTVVAVDTVGAGDAFIGALAFFIAKFPTSNWFQRIGASMEIATHSVQFKGTQTSYQNFPVINPTEQNYAFDELL